MSVRLEWSSARHTDVELLPEGAAAPDGQTATHHGERILLVGGFAIEGPLDEIRDLAARILRTVYES